jgi:hypothetical protein
MTFWKSNIYNSQPLAFGHPKMFSELWGLNRVHLSPASKWWTCVDSDPDTKKCGWTGPRWTPMKMLVFSVPHLCWDPVFYQILGENMWDPIQFLDCQLWLTRVISALLWCCQNFLRAIIRAPSFWIRLSEYNRPVSEYNPDHAITLSYLHDCWPSFACYFTIPIFSIWSP